MPVIEAKNPEHFIELIKNDRCIVDFFATWCPPCKRLGEKLEEISKKLDDITIVKVDINELDTVAQVYNIKTIPYIVFYKKSMSLILVSYNYLPFENIFSKYGSGAKLER